MNANQSRKEGNMKASFRLETRTDSKQFRTFSGEASDANEAMNTIIAVMNSLASGLYKEGFNNFLGYDEIFFSAKITSSEEDVTFMNAILYTKVQAMNIVIMKEHKRMNAAIKGSK